MHIQLRHVVPVLGLLLTPALALAQEAQPAAVPLPATPLEGEPGSGEAAAAQDPMEADAEGAEEPRAGAAEGHPGEEELPTDEAAEAPSPSAASRAAAAPEAMPSHAPLREEVADGGIERRRRVPLAVFNDYWALARFTESEPVLHEKARSIAARTETALWVSLGSNVVAGALVGLSVVNPSCENGNNGPRCTPNMGLLLGGVGTALAGYLITSLILPKAKDFEELADAWNATIDEPIVPEPGLDPAGTDQPAPEAASP